MNDTTRTCSLPVHGDVRLLFNQAAVPLRAFLRHSLQRTIVHIDDTESHPVAVGPLEVVQQGPDEVPGERYTFGNRTAGRIEIPLEVLLALWIVHRAVMHPHIAKR